VSIVKLRLLLVFFLSFSIATEAEAKRKRSPPPPPTPPATKAPPAPVAQAGVAPVVVTSVPAADSAGFAIDANLTLTFSQPLDAATVTPENIQLTEGEFAIQCTATLAGHVVTLAPSGALEPQKKYTVTVSSALKGTNGVAVAERSFSFTSGAMPPPPPPPKKKKKGFFKKVTSAVSHLAKSPAKLVKKAVKVVKKGLKTVQKLHKKIIKKIVKFIKDRIIGPILKKLKKMIARLFAPIAKKMMPLVEKLVLPLLEKVVLRGGMFGMQSLSRWSTYLKDGQLDVERIKREIFERVSAAVLPKVRDLTDSVLGKGMMLLRRFTDPIISTAVGGIGSIPFVGGLLASVASMAYNSGMESLQSTIAGWVEQFIKKNADRLFSSTVGKLLDKLLPKVNRFLSQSKLGGVLSTLLESVPDGPSQVTSLVDAIRQKAQNWSEELQKKAQEAATRFVVSGAKLENLIQTVRGLPQKAKALQQTAKLLPGMAKAAMKGGKESAPQGAEETPAKEAATPEETPPPLPPEELPPPLPPEEIQELKAQAAKAATTLTDEAAPPDADGGSGAAAVSGEAAPADSRAEATEAESGSIVEISPDGGFALVLPSDGGAPASAGKSADGGAGPAEEVQVVLVPDPQETKETAQEAKAIGANADELHASEALVNRPAADLEPIKRKAKGFGGKVIGIVMKLFKPVISKALKHVESSTQEIADQLASTTNRVDISLIEQLAGYVENGRVNQRKVLAALNTWASGFVLERIEPRVDALIAKGFSLLRGVTDPIIASAVGVLGSIPFVGGAVAAAASMGFNEGMKYLAGLIAGKAKQLLRQALSKILGKVTAKLLRPVLAQVTKFLEKSRIGQKALGALQKFPEAVAKVKGMVEKVRSGAKNWSQVLSARVEEWAARKVQAERLLDAVRALAGAVTGDEPPDDPVAPDAQPDAP
jgi:hypothetical protein